MSINPILIVAGEPNSIFLEIFFKAIKSNKFKTPIILIASQKILLLQMEKLGFKKKINILNFKKLNLENLNNKCINLIDVNYEQKYAFKKITNKSNKYINECFNVAFKILKKGLSTKLINGPISKKNLLNKNYLGITEYLAKKFKSKSNAMLIYNKELSVCPITTHLPLNLVAKSINKKILKEKINLIDKFYKNKIGFKPTIAVTGLNPHCESINKYNEDEKIISPLIKSLKKKINIFGPFPADTIFLKNNRNKFDVIVGMYHDQVLAPMKTIFEYDAINITLGLPFIRISPDHGPNEKMIGKNKSNPLSLIKAITFLDKN